MILQKELQELIEKQGEAKAIALLQEDKQKELKKKKRFTLLATTIENAFIAEGFNPISLTTEEAKAFVIGEDA